MCQYPRPRAERRPSPRRMGRGVASRRWRDSLLDAVGGVERPTEPPLRCRLSARPGGAGGASRAWGGIVERAPVAGHLERDIDSLLGESAGQEAGGADRTSGARWVRRVTSAFRAAERSAGDGCGGGARYNLQCVDGQYLQPGAFRLSKTPLQGSKPTTRRCGLQLLRWPGSWGRWTSVEPFSVAGV